MTDPVAIALIAGAVAIITGLPTFALGVMTLRQSRKNETTSTDIGAVLEKKSDDIHHLADGNLAKMQERIDKLEGLLTSALGSASHAEGQLHEQSDERSRQSVTKT